MKTIKKLSLLCLFCLISIGASAYSFESGGIYYNITSSTDLTCEVTYGGKSYLSASYSGIVNIPANVGHGGKTYTVTTIGKNAFYNCVGLTYVLIPNGVMSIERNAFYGCTGLTEITIPNSVTNIEYGAFYGCTNMLSITNLATIPQKIKSNLLFNYGRALHVCEGYKEVYENALYWKDFNIHADVQVVKVSSIEIDENSYHCGINKVGQAKVKVLPVEALNKKVLWSSSDNSKLFIDVNTGQFVGLAAGAVTITATATDGSGVSGNAMVIVQ